MSTRVLGALPTSVAYQRFRVRVVDGPDKGRVADDVGGELSIGTAEGNHLALTDPTVSRHHLVIAVTPRGLHVRDVGSTNGVSIGPHRVESAWLDAGSQIKVGITSLRLEHGEGTVEEPLSADDHFGRAIGRSTAMRRLFAMLPRIANSESTVLLEGETGTGKTLLAEAIHSTGPRARGPFIIVDCGAIPPSLVESELFGHERGAFTGAHGQRIGAIEAARGGTIFFDEIGEMPLDLQPRLLRAIEDRTIKRVGGTERIQVDMRVIAATNQGLRAAVNRGAFRGDLYYRLNIVSLRLPPLRERREDIALLAESFYEHFAGRTGAPPELVEELARHDWPGNVRELRAAVERAVLLGDPAAWESAHDPDAAAESRSSALAFDPSQSFRTAKEHAMASWERAYLAELIRRHDGNLSRAARAARMDRTHLRELGRRYRLLPVANDGGDDGASED